MCASINKSLILNKLKEYLGFKKNKDFAEFLGIAPQTLSSWYSRNTFDVALVANKCTDINISWLLTGIGAMLDPKSGKLPKDNIFYLPYISVAEYSNYIEKHNDASYIEALPQLVVKHMPLNPSTVKYAFEVANNSMLDETVRLSYATGDVVFADNINGDYTRIVERKTYVVVLKNEIRLCFCELADNDKLILSSRDKALFPDKTISINEALQIFFVIGGSFSR